MKSFCFIVTSLLVFAVAYILIDNFYLDKRSIHTRMDSKVGEQKSSVEEEAYKTIAVLPFSDLSPERDQQYFVDGLTEEILNNLAKISEFRVTSRTSSFEFRGSNKTLQEIANILGVEYLIEGSVRKAGNALRITAQLIRAADGFHLWSETYDRELKDIFAVQKDIATTVADELKVTLGIGSPHRLLGGTDNKEAYELYLTAQRMFDLLDQTKQSRSFKLIDAAIALDPEFAMAWVFKARAFNARGELDEGLKATQKAIELEPNLAEAYLVLEGIRFAKGEYIKAGLALQKVAELTTEPFGTIGGYINRLLFFGYLEQAKEAVEAALRSDPLNEGCLNNAIAIFGRLGDLQRAEEAYERAKAISGGILDNKLAYENIYNLNINGARLLSGNVVSSDDIVDPDPVMVALKEYVGSPKEGLAELRRLYKDADSQLNLISMWMWAAYFGDTELAMEILEKWYSITHELNDIVWYPAMKQVRQQPRFKEIVRENGFVDYWNQFGWPDLCHPTDDGDFVCD